MPSNLIPEQFTDYAMKKILDYLRHNRECWEGKTNEEIDEFKEEVEHLIFNTNLQFITHNDCTEFINESADLIFFIIDYVAEMDEEYGGGQDKSLIAQFNRCWYYTGMEMIRDEWDDLIEKLNDDTDNETDTEMSG